MYDNDNNSSSQFDDMWSDTPQGSSDDVEVEIEEDDIPDFDSYENDPEE